MGVLAAKSIGMFGDQEIMKWIRKGKKVNSKLAQEWKKIGTKALQHIFVEQFEKYKEMSHYLMNNVDIAYTKNWENILSENEYIWPVGQNQGWLNIFREIPDLCSKMDSNLASNPNISEQKSACTIETTSPEKDSVAENVSHEEREKVEKESKPILVQ